jgi:L-threonate 2-dehydrogenase
MITVGVIGVGIMGSAIARNLLAPDIAVIGFDIAADRQAALEAMGGKPAPSAAAVAETADVILTSLPGSAALEETIAGILARRTDRTLILAELSTLPIETKVECRDRLAAAGVQMLDCPLSGTGAQALNRDLVVYASGERMAFERAAPIFARFARSTHYLGEFGNGSRMKFVANLLVAIHNVASAEAMVLGMKAGLDARDIVKVIADGAGTSRVFELRAPLMARGDYQPPSMKVSIWQKDMTVIADFARDLGVATPLFAASAPIYDAAIGLGLSGEDTAAVCAVLEKMAGIERA